MSLFSQRTHSDLKNSITDLKNVIPINPEITFASSNDTPMIVRSIEIPNKSIDHFVEPSKPTGRPKSNKLSALAAKRNIAKRNIKVGEKTSVEKDETKESLTSIAQRRKDDLSVSQKLALSQNLRHMVCQVRSGADSISSDLIGLTNGLNCKEVDSSNIVKMILNGPSKGMGLLFPGQKINALRCNCLKSLIPPTSINSVISDHSFLAMDSVEITCFDFQSSPVNDVMMDLKKEQEKNQRRNQRPKRLLKPTAPRKKSPKRKTGAVDSLTIRRILKKRFKQEKHQLPRIMVIGPQSSGKSSLIGQLSHALNDEIDEKFINKLRWEAQKAGRPHDCYAWIVDQLDGERKFGRTREVSDIVVECSSEKVGHIFDCPGDHDLLTNSIDMISIAEKLIVVVDVTSITQEASQEKSRVEDLFRLLNERTKADNFETVFILNKMDKCEWSKTVADKVVRTLTSMLEKITLSRDHKLMFIPVSTRTSEGIMRKNSSVHFDDELQNQMTVAESIERLSEASTINLEPQECDLQPLVTVVHDVYENRGAGFTAILLIKDGVLSPGQQLICNPSGSSAQVRSVQIVRRNKLVSVAAAVRGELVHTILHHVDSRSVQRGSILCDPTLASGKIDNLGVVRLSRIWKAEIYIHSINGKSIIPGRNIIFHSFSKSCHGYLRRLLWVSKIGGSRMAEDGEVKLNPYVVSSANVTLGIELQLDELHPCLLDRSVNSEFTLLDGTLLFASGSLVDFRSSSDEVTEYPFDLKDPSTIYFHREVELEDMEVDDDTNS